MTIMRAQTVATTPRAEERVGVGLWFAGRSLHLVTHALGSCVAVCAWDHNGVGGLLHVLLPEAGNAQLDPARPGTYADVALPRFRDALLAAGARPSTLRAKLVGGAAIPDAPAAFQIGKRNILAVRRVLWQLGMAIVAEDVGGTLSRSVRFSTDRGVASITSPGAAPREL